MEDLDIDQEIGSWNVEITSQKREKEKNRTVIEPVICFDQLDTPRKIYDTVANISLSTLSFYSTIRVLRDEDMREMANIPYTSFNIVNFKEKFSTEIFINLLRCLVNEHFYDENGNLLDSIFALVFKRQGVNYSIELHSKGTDSSRNALIIGFLNKFLRPYDASDPNRQLYFSIEVETRNVIDNERNPNYGKDLNVKNTMDSAYSLFLKHFPDMK